MVSTLVDEPSNSSLLELGESTSLLLLANWLPAYLASCYEHEVASILAALEKLIRRTRHLMARQTADIHKSMPVP
jgi:TorA maturation chaperone TorD